MTFGKGFIFKPEDMTLAFIIESAFAYVESGSSAFAFFPFKVLPSFLVPIALHKEICSFAFQFLVCSVLLFILLFTCRLGSFTCAKRRLSHWSLNSAGHPGVYKFVGAIVSIYCREVSSCMD